MINCKECGGECCKSISIQIEKPTTKEDFEDLKWYLYHKGMFLYIDNENDWVAEIPIKTAKRCCFPTLLKMAVKEILMNIMKNAIDNHCSASCGLTKINK